MGRDDLRGRVCLVTGASGGIGRAVVSALARAGADVVAAGRDAERLRQLHDVPRLVCDLAEPGAARRLAAEALAVRGRVDVLVNCAGVGQYGGFASLDDVTIARLLAVNVAAPVELTRALLPPMLERQSGHVVNVGSIAAHVGRRLEVVYAASKAALATFSESLRAELRGTGVGVSLVSPGVVDTEFFARRGAPYDREWPSPIAPDRVAAAVVRAIRDDRAEILVPGWLAVPARLSGAAPAVYRALARRFD
jgi:short-subunit dehydrogenase